MEVDQIIRKVPEGKLITINNICTTLAKKHNATIICSMTTGILVWIATKVAGKREKNGERDITPY